MCLLTSCRRKTFSMALTNMLWVCKSFSRIRGTQRTLNQERATRRKKNGPLQGGQLWIFSKSSQNPTRNFHLFAFSKGACWLHVDVKNFLWHLRTCSGYVKASPGSGEHSARWIRNVRHVEKKTARFKADNYGFFRNQVKIRPEISIFSRFLRVLADFMST